MTDPATSTKRRVLVIDDNEAIHADFRKIFEVEERPAGLLRAKAGLFGDPVPEAGSASRPQYSVDAAQQGQDGLEKVKEAIAAGRPYQVAFVDMRMPPGWDGLETIKHIWEIDSEIQVVVCTAYSDYSIEEINEALGYSDRLLMIKKPFDKAEVIQAANALSEKWLLRRTAGLRLEELERMVQDRTAGIEHALLHDKLTGLPNRTLLLERISGCIARRKRERNHHYAVLFIDFDRFKMVNDSLGHEIGDLLLIEVAQRLQEALRGTDVVCHASTAARLGGDEFIVLLEGLREVADAARVAERLLSALELPHSLNGQTVHTTASIGIATSDGNYEQAGDMIRDADTAMYRAKAAGRDAYVIFDSRMHDEVRERFRLENALRKSLEDSDFVLHYQPIMRLQDRRLAGFEALLRWNHPTQGLVSAGEVIPIAEDTGLILPLGLWVLRRACEQLKTWEDRYPRCSPLQMSVNLSRRQLMDGGLIDKVGEILQSTGVDPKHLALEITESVILDDPAKAARIFEVMRGWGIWLHLDDFGTGYSSLACLHQLPLSGLKIDRTFVTRICEGQEHATVLEAVMNIARAYHLRVIAEGVETPEQAELLRKLDCDQVQGYLFGRPLAAPEAEKLIRSQQRVEAECVSVS